MGVVTRRPAFKRDLFHVYDYIANDNPKAAIGFVEGIEKVILTLSDHPHMGTVRLPKFPDVRMFPHESCKILYLPLADPTGIELLRLFGPYQDWESRMAREYRSKEIRKHSKK